MIILRNLKFDSPRSFVLMEQKFVTNIHGQKQPGTCDSVQTNPKTRGHRGRNQIMEAVTVDSTSWTLIANYISNSNNKLFLPIFGIPHTFDHLKLGCYPA